MVYVTKKIITTIITRIIRVLSPSVSSAFLTIDKLLKYSLNVTKILNLNHLSCYIIFLAAFSLYQFCKK